MIEKYLEKIHEHNSAHPVSEGDFSQWRDNVVTKRLFADIEIACLEVLERFRITKNDSDIVWLAATMVANKDLFNQIKEWIPAELDND